MKFENPMMNISMFEVESILTLSAETTGIGEAADAADAAIAQSTGTAKKIEIIF